MSTLNVEKLNYRYEGGTKNVLIDANIKFESGKVYTIIGKSGSGKTTLLALLAGLANCNDGDITYNGKSINSMDLDQYRARDIGVVFQSYNLLTTATAVENIVLSMNISGVHEKNKKAWAYALLEKVGVDRETADRKVLKLSGGEQQRVAIARALSHDPDIILADEPTGNLDGDTEKGILDIFTSLAHDDGRCVIIVTHSNNVTANADEIWAINKGKLLYVLDAK